MKRTLVTYILILIGSSFFAMSAATDTSTKKERNLIREGNQYYNEQNFAEAEKLYRKALEENANSELAAYNLATSLIRQSGNADPNAGNNPMKEASEILTDLARSAQDTKLAEYAAYNLGNIAFNQQQYQQSIELYKNALRRNPDNDKARQNLRLAQLKLQEQQNQQQNQDKNEEQNQEQQQNKDQQQNQDQNKEQNKDQEKNDEQNQGQNKEESKNQQEPPKQEQGSISDANAAKILKTMENEENATRRKVNELKKREEQSQRRRTTNQW